MTIYPQQTGHFRGGLPEFLWREHILKLMIDRRVRETVQNDGAGGKPQFFTLLNEEEAFNDLGWEIITMNADDVVAGGGFPAIMANDLNVKRVTAKNIHLCRALWNGHGAALRQAGLANITGETAVMKHSITAFCDTDSDGQLVLTWGGTCIGLTRTDLRIDGSSINSGMAVVGFREFGYRCNGGTALTNIVLGTWGPEIDLISNNATAMAYVKKLTVPSRSYARTITRLLGWTQDGEPGPPLARIHGIAHVTGGGVWSKLGELLPEGIGVHLDQMPEAPEVLLKAQSLSLQCGDSPLSDYDCYNTFHGGCGMFVICEPTDVQRICEEAWKDGHEAMVVGKTVHAGVPDQKLIIESRFSDRETLSLKTPGE
ncbi:MAG: AIR synthase-related protein [Parcubacteria group bacterium]